MWKLDSLINLSHLKIYYKKKSLFNLVDALNKALQDRDEFYITYSLCGDSLFTDNIKPDNRGIRMG
jgi:hypothetical protein